MNTGGNEFLSNEYVVFIGLRLEEWDRPSNDVIFSYSRLQLMVVNESDCRVLKSMNLLPNPLSICCFRRQGSGNKINE